MITAHPIWCVDVTRFGRGLFAVRHIAPGELLLTFGGPMITFEEAVALGCTRESHALQVGMREYVLLDTPACLVNHSCVPNSGIRNGSLIALRKITKGQEILYDYSTTMDEDYWEMVCNCQRSACRGLIRDFKYLDASLQKQYLDAGVVQPFIARRYGFGLGRKSATILQSHTMPSHLSSPLHHVQPPVPHSLRLTGPTRLAATFTKSIADGSATALQVGKHSLQERATPASRNRASRDLLAERGSNNAAANQPPAAEG